MKPLKKEDMPKMILLGILSVCVLGYVIFELATGMGSPQAAAPPPPPAGGAQVASATPVAGGPSIAGGPGAPAPGASPDPDAQNPEVDLERFGPPTGGKDPFSENGPASSWARMKAAAAPPPVPPIPVPTSIGAPARTIQGIIPGAVAAAETATALIKPQPVLLPPPSDLTVVGVVLADRDSSGVKHGPDVAILRGGGADRRFVTVGDPVGNQYVVAGIHAYGVDVRSGDHISTIRLASAISPSGQPSPIAGAAGVNGVTTRAN